MCLMKNISKKIFKKYFLVVVTMLNGLLKICQLLKKPKTNKMANIDKENVRIFTENGKLVRLELKLNGKIVFTLEENKEGADIFHVNGIVDSKHCGNDSQCFPLKEELEFNKI